MASRATPQHLLSLFRPKAIWQHHLRGIRYGRMKSYCLPGCENRTRNLRGFAEILCGRPTSSVVSSFPGRRQPDCHAVRVAQIIFATIHFVWMAWIMTSCRGLVAGPLNPQRAYVGCESVVSCQWKRVAILLCCKTLLNIYLDCLAVGLLRFVGGGACSRQCSHLSKCLLYALRKESRIVHTFSEYLMTFTNLYYHSHVLCVVF